jgi:hypothetical protein
MSINKIKIKICSNKSDRLRYLNANLFGKYKQQRSIIFLEKNYTKILNNKKVNKK